MGDLNFKIVNTFMTKVLLIWSICFLFGCTLKKKDFDIQNLSGNEIGVVGHAGIGFSSFQNDTPPNSMASLDRAVNIYGANGLELDIQVNYEGQLFVFHDRSLYPSTHCTGCIFEYSEAELRNCTYRNGDLFPQQWNEPILTLEEVLIYFYNQESPPLLFLDIESNPLCESSLQETLILSLLETKLLYLIDQYAANDWIITEPNNLTLAQNLVAKNPKIKLSWLAEFSATNIGLAVENQFWGMVTSNDSASQTEIEAVHAAGLRASLFALKTQSAMVAAVEKQPDFLQTDNIVLLQQILNQ